MTQAMRAVEVRVPEQHVRSSGRKAVMLGCHWQSACVEAGLHSAIMSFTDRMLSPDTDSAVLKYDTCASIFSELIISYFIPLIQAYKNKTN